VGLPVCRTALCLTRRPINVTSRQRQRKTAAMPAGHMAARVNPSVRLPVGFKHEFGGCGNRATSLGGRARSIFHFTHQLVGSSARCPSARLGRGASQVRALSLLVGSSRRAGRHSFARFTVCARQHSVVAARAGSGLRCVRPFGVSRSLAITSSVPAHRSDLHPSNRKVALVVAR
jgi:hypothetical protein